MTSLSDKASAATQAMRKLFPPTPLQKNAFLSERYGADIWLKREDLSPVRSYKIRGAFNAITKHLVANPDQSQFVCASAGNHAQGVAYICKHLGKHGTIFMPVTTPQQKISKTQAFGGSQVEIRLVGDYFDDTLAAAKAFCETSGAHFLSPFDDPDVMEGQASVAVELLDQLGKAPDRMILPVGGGGLSGGVLAFLDEIRAPTRVKLVEPAGGASLAAALRAGHPVTLPYVDNFVDGAAVARIGDAPFKVLSRTDPGDVLAAPENRICATISELLNVEGIVLEPAGALSIDALADMGAAMRGQSVVCVTSGGNFDFERLPEVKERAMHFQGVKKYFILRLPQRPGALREFLDLLGPNDNIARFEYLKKSARSFGSVLIGIETSAPENFKTLFTAMDESGLTYRDITEDEVLAEFMI